MSLIQKAVKITSLLTQYLYEQRRLDLPGIGSFVLDPSSTVAVGGKNSAPLPPHIHFEHRTDLREPTDLIRFISEQTGKMKALAASDLDSFIELAQQFLNIGKPFVLEGIGTLVRLKPGEYEFTAAPPPTTDRRRDTAARETAKTVAREETTERYESFLSEPKPKEGWRKPVLIVAVLAGLALAIWGGYRISQKPADNNEPISEEPTLSETASTNVAMQPIDSSSQQPVTQSGRTNVDSYTYVLENAGRQRAFKRYNQLRTNLWDVQLSTTDSVQFKLYLTLPVNYGDTSRIKDSLRVMLGRPVYIE